MRRERVTWPITAASSSICSFICRPISARASSSSLSAASRCRATCLQGGRWNGMHCNALEWQVEHLKTARALNRPACCYKSMSPNHAQSSNAPAIRGNCWVEQGHQAAQPTICCGLLAGPKRVVTITTSQLQ
jgi:hypothetical protein